MRTRRPPKRFVAALFVSSVTTASAAASELPSGADLAREREPFPAREVDRSGMLSAGWGEAGVAIYVGSGQPGRIELRTRLGLPRSQFGLGWDGPLGAEAGARPGWINLAYERRIAGQPTPTRQVSFGASMDVPVGVAQPAAELHLRLRARTGPLVWSSELGFGRSRVGASRAGVLSPGATGPRALGAVGVQVGPLFFDVRSSGAWEVGREKAGWCWVEGAGTVHISRGLELRATGGHGWQLGAEPAPSGEAWWSLAVIARGG